MFSPSTEALYEAHARAERLSDARQIVLGLGTVAVGHAIIHGLPSLTFTPVETSAPLGTRADDTVPRDRLLPGSTILSFATMDGALHHLDRIMMLMLELEGLIYAQAEDTP
jgi:hypothetical protein